MSDSAAAPSVAELLRETKVEVAPASYVVVGVGLQDWQRLLEDPDLSPRANAPFMILRDAHEVTMVIEEDDWRRIRHAVRDARSEAGYRLVTLDIELPWTTVGYLARITELLAAEKISVGVLSSFTRDHLLIKQADLGNALRVLGEHVGELC
ncbi:MAG: amino acid-binding domain protein [Acidobacteria bacterium]|nr:amino acid-binding domain protein [Acidobacteriota bacterium]